MSQVLITRPAPHNKRISQLLEEEGISSNCVPVLDTQITPLDGAEQSHLYNFDLFDLVIIISANAAKYLANHLDKIWPQTPSHPKWLCIGHATQRELLNQLDDIDPANVGIPDGNDSEALLKHRFAQTLNGKKVLIVKGEGGRPLIEQSLQQQGAQHTVLELYKRILPNNQLDLITSLKQPDLKFIHIASGDSYKNLIALSFSVIDSVNASALSIAQLFNTANASMDAKSIIHKLKDVIWIVPSQRVKTLMIEDGVSPEQIDVSDGASDQALLARLCHLV